MSLYFNWQVELHPMLVHFAIGLMCFAFLLDAIGGIWKSQSARLGGLYCLIGGTLGTVLSVVSGKITPEAQEREGGEALRQGGQILAGFFSGRRVNVHEHWGYLLLVLVVLWLAMRLLAHYGKLRPGLALSVGALALIVLFVTGYQGGELVYRRRESGQLMKYGSIQSLRPHQNAIAQSPGPAPVPHGANTRLEPGVDQRRPGSILSIQRTW
jgi:uncharacterized membrane protein